MIQHRYSFLFSLMITFAITTSAVFAGGYNFPSFNVGTITSNTPVISTSLDVSGITDDYLFYVVTADFSAGTPIANSAWSSSIELVINNGGSIEYKSSSIATSGSENTTNSTTLIWSGLLSQLYSGGTNLTLDFKDSYHDASGPYNSNLNNVKVTIYRTPIPELEFPSFNVGTITSNTPVISSSLDVTGITEDYLFYVVTADFTAGDPLPSSAWSNSIELAINNGGSIEYKSSSIATSGSENTTNSTTLIWSGLLNQLYSGGTNLTLDFKDSYHDASGPYNSNLNNVKVTIYSEPSPTNKISLETFLEGGYNSSTSMMNLELGANISKTSPYPADLQSVTAIPTNVVDWVLVELRDKTTNTIIVDSRSAFILKTGEIVDIDGTSDLQFYTATSGQYFVVIKHRNHLSIMSSGLVDL